MTYRSNGTGFILYSFGDNGRDDGGRGGDLDEGETDDIAIASRDWAWTPAEKK
ncbi:MAG: hypothetical protein QM811_02850 [Pirellulales bacterium]